MLCLRVVERILSALEERHVDVHPAPVLVLERFGHERGVDLLAHRHFLHHLPVGHHRVGHRQRIRVAQVYLVLTVSHLVMAVLHGDAHLFQREHRLPPQVGALVQRRGEVEVAARVERLRLLGRLQVEVLHLRAHLELVALLGRALQGHFQDVARVSLERLARRAQHVAEHAGDCVLARTPGKDRERRRVGHRNHVALVPARESLHRGAVEGHAVFQRPFEFRFGDSETLERPQDVSEPEADELDVVLLGSAEDVLPCLLVAGYRHGPPPPRPNA